MSLTGRAAGVAGALSFALAGQAGGAELRHSVVERPGGVHLVVVEAGDPAKPGILFIHGFAQSHLAFHRQFASDLAKNYHLVAFDLRGEGASDKPSDPKAYSDTKTWADDVDAVMNATHLKKPLVVAWSFGGYVAMDYVRHYGVGRISGVDMVGSLGGLKGMPPGLAANMALTQLSVSDSLADNIASAEGTAKSYAVPQTTAEDLTMMVATELMMPAYVRRAMMLRDYDHADVLPKLTCPVLLSADAEDVYAPLDMVQALKAALPDARISTYHGVGHLSFAYDAERFDREVDAFARETGAQ